VEENRPNGLKIYQHLSLQGTPKFTRIGIIWSENTPSGSPVNDSDVTLATTRAELSVPTNRSRKLERLINRN
jgi:hypothetical protein